MPCCGQNRLAAAQPARQPSGQPAGMFLQYTGRTAITVIGRVTGRKYHFATPGSRQTVDPRDRTSLRGIGTLRETR